MPGQCSQPTEIETSPVVVKAFVSYSSELEMMPEAELPTPATKTMPLFSRAAVWYSRTTLRLAVGAKVPVAEL